MDVTLQLESLLPGLAVVWRPGPVLADIIDNIRDYAQINKDLIKL